MAFINDALTYQNLAALKALPAASLVDTMFYSCLDANGSGQPAWYVYKAAATTPANEPQVAVPANGSGRFIAMGLGTPGGGGSAIIPGYLTCQCKAPFYHTEDYGANQSHRYSGKAIRILENATHTFNVKVTSGFVSKLPSPSEIIADGLDANKIIEVHRWSQPPNGSSSSSPPVGREWVADLPATGGSVSVAIDNTYRWISVMARNYDNSSNTPHGYPNRNSKYFDTVYLQWHNTSDIWLWTFTDDLDLTPEINATGNYSSAHN